MNKKSAHGFFILLCLLSLPVHGDEQRACTFHTYQWNVQLKKAVNRQRVDIRYDQLSAIHFDKQSGCSVCEQDQQTLHLPGLPAFRLCKRIAPQVATVLYQSLQQGFPLHSITGYRVGMTRGDTDSKGNRTQFSNHSFGIAIDINAEYNGLYDRCIHFGPHCRLIRGGQWQPGYPGALTYDSPLVNAMKAIGLRWGGQIQGKQKDFMHFSLTGY